MDGYHRNNQRRACLLEVDSVEKYYGSPQAVTKALDQIGFRVQAGSTSPSWAPPAPARPPF